MRKKKVVWTNRCSCHNYIPDSYTECDTCLLKRVGLYEDGVSDSMDRWSVEDPLYPEQVVLQVLRSLMNPRPEV